MNPDTSRLSHCPNVEGGSASAVHWTLSHQRACSSPQAVALNHVGVRPHLLPRVLQFEITTQSPNCMGCYSFTDPKWREG